MKKKIIIGILITGICLVFIVLGSYVSINNDKKMNHLDGVTMVIKEGTLTKTSATIIITDLSEKKHTYGESFKIEKKVGLKWKELKGNDYWFNLPDYSVDETNQLEMKQNWNDMYGELGKGKYRLVKTVGNEKISVEFTIQ